MKVLIVTNMYPCHDDVSWRGGFVKDQVDAYQTSQPETIIDVYHIKAKISGGSNFSYIRAFFNLTYKFLFEKYDVVHSHHAFCTLLCLFNRSRLVYTVHEGELNNKKIRSALIKLAIRLAKSVVYVSQSEFSKSKKIKKYLLPCGVNHVEFAPAEDALENKKKLGLPLDRSIILFPADPNRPEKNASILKQVEKAAKDAGENWTFLYGGKIDKSDMPLYMQASDIVVSIGQYESDGMVIKEALACNTPVLATNVGNAELYVNNRNGILIEAQPKEAYRAISKILIDNESYRNGREHLLQLGQDMECVSKNLNDIYRSLSANK